MKRTLGFGKIGMNLGNLKLNEKEGEEKEEKEKEEEKDEGGGGFGKISNLLNKSEERGQTTVLGDSFEVEPQARRCKILKLLAHFF